MQKYNVVWAIESNFAAKSLTADFSKDKRVLERLGVLVKGFTEDLLLNVEFLLF